MVEDNFPLKRVCEEQIERQMKVIPKRGKSDKNARSTVREKAITQLVVKLESIFTSPDLIYVHQEDEAFRNPNK